MMNDRRIASASLLRHLGGWRDAEVSTPTYRRLADGVRMLVLDGRLPLGAALPGERELAAAAGVSRTTAAAAYALLCEQGYLRSRPGAASRTAIPERPGARLAGRSAGPGTAVAVDLGIASMPAPDAVHRAYLAAIEGLPHYLPTPGYEPVGLPVLRAVIADRFAKRGLPTAPEQILVTHGAQHGLALVLRAFAQAGDTVVIDHPTYPHAIDAIRGAHCRPIPVALPPQGWDVAALGAAFRQTAPRLAYLLPDFHNPTGRCMNEAERLAVAEAAAASGTRLIADETMVDLWHDAPPPPPLAAFDGTGAAVTLGSTGTSFWGGLRIGWIRADAPTITALALTRASIDLGTPVLEQLAATTLLADDRTVLDARRAQLRSQCEALVGLIRQSFPTWHVAPPVGGVALWAEMPMPIASALAAAGEAAGVRIAPGPRFGIDGAFERCVRLACTAPPATLEDGVTRLAQAAASLGSGRPRPRRPIGPSRIV